MTEDTHRENEDRRFLSERISFLPGLYEEVDQDFSEIDVGQHIPNSPYNYSGVERSEYLFELERSNAQNKISMSTIYFIKGTVGVGYLGIHEGFSYAGIWTSLAVCIIFALLVPHTYLTVGRSAQRLYLRLRVPKLSYPGVGEAALGLSRGGSSRKSRKLFRYTIEMCLYIQFCGLCCLYKLVIAEVFKFALEHLSKRVADENLDLRIYIIIIVIPLAITCACRNLKCLFFLVPFSVAADLFLAVCVIIAFVYSLQKMEDVTQKPTWISLSGTFNFVAIFLYSIDGSTHVLPAENNMQRPRYFPTVINIGMLLVIVFVINIGFFGYWVWGDMCKTPFVLLMPSDHIFIIMQLILCFLLCSSYAVSLWVPYKIVWMHLRRHIKRKRNVWAVVVESVHIIVITLIALVYPFPLKIMCILGMFTSTPLTFIFPPIIEELVFWNEHRATICRWRLMKNILLVILGFAIVIGGIVINIVDPEFEKT